MDFLLSCVQETLLCIFMDNAKQFCTFMDTVNFIMNKNDMHELCTLDNKYKNGIQLRVISFEKIKKWVCCACTCIQVLGMQLHLCLSCYFSARACPLISCEASSLYFQILYLKGKNLHRKESLLACSVLCISNVPHRHGGPVNTKLEIQILLVLAKRSIS